jgi:antitoxin (DNA-binding transcriptional repressor) of toxin-antitoxin stability system
MELRIKAAKTRSVSARELSRSMADLMDEMETEGFGLVVLRYGRPAALMVPIEPNVRRAPRRVSIEKVAADAIEETVDVSALGDDERRLLLAMADRLPERYSPDSWVGPIAAFSIAFTNLEFEGMSVRDGGHWLTEKGERAASLLREASEAA